MFINDGEGYRVLFGITLGVRGTFPQKSARGSHPFFQETLITWKIARTLSPTKPFNLSGFLRIVKNTIATLSGKKRAISIHRQRSIASNFFIAINIITCYFCLLVSRNSIFTCHDRNRLKTIRKLSQVDNAQIC